MSCFFKKVFHYMIKNNFLDMLKRFLSQNRLPLVIAVTLMIATINVVLGCFLHEIPDRDVAARYAPMAEFFASGEWEYAFHPRIQMLQPLTGGIIAFLFKCNGFTALKIASMLWFIGGAFVCWKLFRELYKERSWVVVAATVFYLIFPYSMHVAYTGLRDSAKCTLLLLLAWALVKICHNVKQSSGYVLLGIGCFLSVICRADMILIGTVALFYGIVLECKEKKYPILSLIPIVIISVAYLFSSFINWYFSGHAMPDFRLAVVFTRLFNRPAQIADILLAVTVIMIFLVVVAKVTEKLIKKISVGYFVSIVLFLTFLISIYTGIKDPHHSVWEFLESFVKGCYHIVGILSLLVVFYRWYQKKLTTGEVVISLVFLANLFLNILPMQIFHKALYVSSRYLYPAVPLLAGFFVIGIFELYRILQKKFSLKLCNAVLILICCTFCITFLFHANQPLLRQFTRKKNMQMRSGILKLASAIKNNYKGEKYRKGSFELHTYNSPKAPEVVFSDNDHKMTAAAYLAGGKNTNKIAGADFFVGKQYPKEFRQKVEFVALINFGKESLNLWRIIK